VIDDAAAQPKCPVTSGRLEPRDVWVVVPVYNEAETIALVLSGLRETGFTSVVVDDRSSDDGAALALTEANWVLKHPINLGQGAALQTGISFALSQGALVIATFDGDHQQDPNDLVTAVNALAANDADFALGSRFLGSTAGMPAIRGLVLRLGVLFTRALSDVAVTDTHNGLRAMTRRGAKAIGISLNRMEHANELLDQIKLSKLKFVEVPVHIRYSPRSLRKGQKTSAALRIAAKLLVERMR
jgi:polyprenyl-phospho-N-acetylgalactosaminyl synthase